MRISREYLLYVTAVLVVAVATLAPACDNTRWGVGELADRNGEPGRSHQNIHTLDLELVATLHTGSDTPAPSWSPSGERVVFTETLSNIIVYNVESEARSVVYSQNNPPANLQSSQYNINTPVFLSEDKLLTAPPWGGSIHGVRVGEDVLMTNAVSGTTTAFGAQGTRPRPSPDGSRVLLGVMEGTQVVDDVGQNLESFPNIYDALWAPDSRRILGIGYMTPNDPAQSLILITEDGERRKLEANAYQPAWHPKEDTLVFIRPNYDDYGYGYYDQPYMQGTLYVYDLKTGRSRILMDGLASNPRFTAEGLLFFESEGRLAVSDLNEVRVFPQHRLSQPQPSPDGEYILGLAQDENSWMLNITIFRLTQHRP